MNWDVFSTTGYVSVALWATVPLLWLAHMVIRPRRWIAHLAVPIAIVALVLATTNSREHVARIQIDRTEQIREQREAEAELRRQRLQERADDAAQVRFAEDDAQDRFDLEGLDEAGLTHFESFAYDSDAIVGDREQQDRDLSASADNSIESRLNEGERQGGVDADESFDVEAEEEPIMVSESDFYLAGRLDSANLKISRWAIVLAFAFLLFDYVRRLNSYRDAYFPLPVPSKWADALNTRQPVFTLPDKPRRPLQDELRAITRRNEVFILLTDNVDAGALATAELPRLPGGRWPIEVLNINAHPGLDDDFVFETLWYGRHSFVVDDPERAAALLDRFIELLAERRGARAHTRQTVHIVWDLPGDVSQALKDRFYLLGRSTGCTLLIHPKTATHEALS